MQGQLWGETIRTAERIEYLLFPRMCALAERAWSETPAWGELEDLELREKAIQKDWNKFANRLGKIELPRLDKLFGGIHYRILLPGAVLENGLLSANTSLPGLVIRYTMDGSEPINTSPVYKHPITFDSPLVKLKTFSSDGQRSSRTIVVKATGY